MKIRSLIYWTVSLVIAAYSADGLSASTHEAASALVAPALSVSTLLAIPDAARSVLLFIGIMAVAFTYQRAWANFRSGPAS